MATKPRGRPAKKAPKKKPETALKDIGWLKEWARKNAAMLPVKQNAPIANLLDYIPQVSEELQSPRHLKPLVDALERAYTEPVRLVVSTPPQHGKSQTVFHFLSQAAARGGRNLLYITYNADFAQSQMRSARRIAERAKVPIRSDSKALCEWSLDNGSSLWATGVGGSITGRPGGIVVVDDPIKDWADAQSPRVREATHDWFRSTVLTRLHPTSSVVVVHTRWHEDDLAGRLIAAGWEHINLPAIDDLGRALWPEERPIEYLEAQRREVGEHIFASLYQGRPIPRGREVFGPPQFADALPEIGYQVALGYDLAYTAKTNADYSVAVVMRKAADKYFVESVVRKQVSATAFAAEVKSLQSQYAGRGLRTRGYIGGTEKGVVDLLGTMGVHLKPMPALADKFARAQPFSAAWNRGDVYLLRGASWLQPVINELQSFTGANDPHDDIVDAMVAAYDELASPPISSRVDVVRPRTSAGLRGHY